MFPGLGLHGPRVTTVINICKFQTTTKPALELILSSVFGEKRKHPYTYTLLGEKKKHTKNTIK